MSSTAIAGIAFVCMMAGAWLGALTYKYVPDLKLNRGSRDMVKLSAGMIATMAALVLGLMISSAYGAFDATRLGLIQSAANYSNLDRILDQYGRETEPIRAALRQNLAAKIASFGGDDKSAVWIEAEEKSTELESIARMLRQLDPQDEEQDYLKSQALIVMSEQTALRWLLIQQSGSAMPTGFLLVLIFWFIVLFGVLSVLSPRTRTVSGVLVLCALSISGGVLLTLDMNQPLDGIIRVSIAPMENTLELLGQ